MIIIYILLGLIAVLLIAAALLPKAYRIEKNIIINRPPLFVRDRIGNLNEYAIWNPWQQSEPGSSKTITGSPNTPGHKYAWQGKKIGEGNLTLKSIDDKGINFELEFIKPWKSIAQDNWVFENWGDNETKVTWQNVGNLPYPIGRLMSAIISKTLNKQFEQGLQNLKKLCEG